MWNASRRSARLTFRSRRSSRLARLLSGSKLMSLSEKPSSDIWPRSLSWKYCDHAVEHLGIGAARDEPHLLHRRHDAGGVAGHRPLEERHHPAPHPLADRGGRAEVEEHDGGRRRPARPAAHQQIPGVRIGVIDAVDEDLLAVGLDAERARPRADRCPGRRAARGRATLVPSIHSVVSTRAVENSAMTRGKRTLLRRLARARSWRRSSRWRPPRAGSRARPAPSRGSRGRWCRSRSRA